MPIIISALQQNQAPVIFGSDYPTPDGTCIRDYVDVRDIARAHLLAAETTVGLPHVKNIGTGKVSSIREIIGLVSTAIGCTNVKPGEKDQRSGDPAFLCADVSLIRSAIGFSSKFSLEMSVKSLV